MCSCTSSVNFSRNYTDKPEAKTNVLPDIGGKGQSIMSILIFE